MSSKTFKPSNVFSGPAASGNTVGTPFGTIASVTIPGSSVTKRPYRVWWQPSGGSVGEIRVSIAGASNYRTEFELQRKIGAGIFSTVATWRESIILNTPGLNNINIAQNFMYVDDPDSLPIPVVIGTSIEFRLRGRNVIDPVASVIWTNIRLVAIET